KQRYSKLKQNLKSPLFIRIPLFDPEPVLKRFQRVARPFFGWAGGIVWLLVVGWAVLQVGIHWSELTQDITDRILSPGNLVILWLTFPLLKAFHEFGHGFAVKVKGGEVHEMGIMFLVFTPIPYVDASAASAFQEKRERVLVGAAGMAVEVFMGAVALALWLNMEAGTLKSVAYNVIFLAGVSSVLFNGNPLLRYDAYYILSDLLEIPNLAPRGLKYLSYLVQKYLFRIKDQEPPVSTPGERIWFVIYTVTSWTYRIFIYTAIILFVASKFFFIGVLFACWGFANLFVWPGIKGVKFLLSSPKLRRKRVQALMITASALALVGFLVVVVPVPLSTIAEGVLWIPEESFVRAKTEGFVEQCIVAPGRPVEKGVPLVQCSDPLIAGRIRVLEARLKELEATYDLQATSDRVKAEITKDQINRTKAELDDMRSRAGDLVIRSEASGLFVVPMAEDMPGRWVKRGDLIGYVLDPSRTTVRVVVDQADIDFIRLRTLGVSVRFAHNISRVLPARIEREVPAATDRLPGQALTKEGGGRIAIDPRDRLGTTAFKKVFLFDVGVPSYEGLPNVGERVYVRFDHGEEPLVSRWYRKIRRLFLRRLNV
ncbi:MAG: hypothetical protein JRJ29_21585, partial [Deltaproteobacteria bacterium]|nr:hypothetical protein [Deltaproteobacteria bacterium]